MICFMKSEDMRWNMELKLDKKKYGSFDYMTIPLKIYPAGVYALVINKVITASVPAMQTFIIASLIDHVRLVLSNEYERAAVFKLVSVLLLLIIFSYCSGSIESYFKLKTEIQAGRNYVGVLLRKTASLPYWCIEDENSCQLIDRVCKDADNRLISGLQYLMDISELVIRVITLLFILSIQVWWAGIAIVAAAIPLFKLSIRAGKENYDAMKDAKQYELLAKDYQKVLTDRTSVEERTLFGFSDAVNDRWLDKYEQARKITLKVTLVNFIKMKVSSLITVVLSLFITSVLLVPLTNGGLSLGMFIAVSSAAFSLIQIMSWQLAWLTERLANAREYMNDLTVYMGFGQAEKVLEKDGEFPPGVESIEFKDITFQYPHTEKYILNHFSFKIEKGKHYAIVGKNGAGKTTITKLLLGLYDDYQGEILIYERDIRSYGKRTLMDMFSVVHQDFARYELSVAENIKLHNDIRDDEQRFDEVLGLSGLKKFTENLPHGTDTYLGKLEKEGVDASGGQWQRIAIARALYKNAEVRILDEPTAALDPVSESEVYKMFGEISQNMTTVFITHRMGAARLADIILVVDDGHAAETGSHEQLVSSGGIYAQMYEMQKEWYQ